MLSKIKKIELSYVANIENYFRYITVLKGYLRFKFIILENSYEKIYYSLA